MATKTVTDDPAQTIANLEARLAKAQDEICELKRLTEPVHPEIFRQAREVLGNWIEDRESDDPERRAIEPMRDFLDAIGITHRVPRVIDTGYIDDAINDSRVLATVLAALRNWQRLLSQHATYKDQQARAIVLSQHHFDDDATPLNVHEIDELCEKINQ